MPPNICTVHEIDEAEGQIFIAMAYIAGQSLKDKIATGPLKLEEALGIAIGVGGGLQEAHEHKIVHRDIKSANIMLTLKGEPKITDFGLAYLADRSKLTKSGTTLGTPVYMSPEQALGKTADRRSDVWSLGVVLYEMITGLLPFEGDHEQVIIYEIINGPHEPVTARRAGLPMELDRIVGKALAKDADERYQHVEDMIVDLRRLSKALAAGKSTSLRTHPGAAPSDAGAQRAVSSPASLDVGVRPDLAPQKPSIPVVPTRKLRLHQGLLAVTAIALLAVAFLYFRQTPPEAPLRRFAFRPPVAVGTSQFNTSVVISPNGKHIVFTAAGAEGKLWIQDLDQREPRAIEGTEGALGPFWSPGSDFIGFAAGGEIKKVSSQGGLPIRVCRIPGTPFFGGAWSPDGEVIVFGFGNPSGFYEVPARGGTPNLLISSRSEGPTGAIAQPHFLPSEAGGRVLVVTFNPVGTPAMMLWDLETGRRELLGAGAVPFYSPSGHLVYQPSRSTHELWALPFSLDTLKAGGEAFPISESSRSPTVAADGTLVYLDGSGAAQQQLVWLDRDGNKTGEIGEAQEDSVDPALSPDGRLVAVAATESSNVDVWVWNIARAVKTRLSTFPETEYRTVWSPSGEEVAFSSARAGNWDILLRQADGSGEAKVLLATPHPEWVSDWSRDGRYILYELVDPETGRDLWYLEHKEDGSGWEPHPFLRTPFNETVPKFSPNGRYVAYSSNESGQYEVYVRPFPEGGRKTTLSRRGGQQPRWSRDGTELFYVEGSTLVAVSVPTGPTFSAGSMTRLFEHPSLTRSFYPQYDVSPDGQRFVLVGTVEAEDHKPPSIHVVQNWYEEFRGREQD